MVTSAGQLRSQSFCVSITTMSRNVQEAAKSDGPDSGKVGQRLPLISGSSEAV